MPAPLIGALSGVLDQATTARDLVSADPSTLDPLRRAARTGVRQFCRGVAGNPLGHAAFGGAGLITSWVCEPLYEEPGNDPGDPSPSPPFTGGQCPVVYSWTLAVRVNITAGGTTTVNRSGTALGPVSVEVTSQPPPVLWRVRVLDVNGNQTGSAQGASSATTFSSYTFTPTRQDGLPDNCGDPPAPPPIPPSVNQPYDWGDVESPDGIPVIAFEPTVDIPINIDVGGINIPISFGNANPDIPTASPVRSNPATPSDGGSPQGGNYSFGEPPEGQEWVGISYSVSVAGGIFGEIPNTFPFTVLPRVIGNARLKYVPANAGGVFPGENHQIRELGASVIRQDPGLIVTGCYAQVNFPAAITVFPLSADKPSES